MKDGDTAVTEQRSDEGKKHKAKKSSRRQKARQRAYRQLARNHRREYEALMLEEYTAEGLERVSPPDSGPGPSRFDY